MQDDTNRQDKDVEREPQSELPSDEKTAEGSDEMKGRTREEFEKLKRHNQELKQKLEEAEKAKQELPDVMGGFRPNIPDPNINLGNYPSLNQNQVEDITQQIIDENGYLKADVLTAQLKAANESAKRAEERAKKAEQRFSKYEETSQTREAYSKYPQLNPNSQNFDPNFYKLVRNEMLNQITENRRDLVAAAEDVAKLYKPKTPKSEQEKEDMEKKEGQKKQINAGLPTNLSGRNYSSSPDDALVEATRKGRKGALAERLSRAGY